jgi:TRAP-type mannitol/chloroaromatic compound transport system permease small subunit
VAHPRVEEYVIDFFDALLLLLPFIAADIFIQYGRRGYSWRPWGARVIVRSAFVVVGDDAYV